jgi:hypothetical protein
VRHWQRPQFRSNSAVAVATFRHHSLTAQPRIGALAARKLSRPLGQLLADSGVRQPAMPIVRTTSGGDMRRIAASLFATFILIAPAFAAPPRAAELETTAGIIKWLNAYRFRPDPDGLPVVVRALSRSQAFKDPETSGAYIGFIAGVLSANPTRAGELIASMLPISPADHWVLVRAIAYSDLPDWKELLATFVDRMPTRRVMIDRYLDGKLPTLSQIAYTKKKDGMLDKLKDEFSSDKDRKKPVAIEPSPELVDLLWGYYLATGCYAPIARIIKLLPGANDKDNVDRLTVGSAAKFTLASNAVRDTELLAMLKWSVKHQPKDVASVLKDVIETAETVDSARMRKEALAAIEDLKLKGSESTRNLSTLGRIGQGAVSLGCVVAAATGHVEFGIPCAIGGAATTAAVYYLGH